MSSDKLKQFAGEKYLSIESYRKNGTAVATPVWFAQDDRELYVYSLANAGKVKRIRNNPRIRIAVCDIRGGLKGEWVEARARILDPMSAKRAHQLLDKKYGVIKKIGGWYSRLMKRERTSIGIMIE